MARKIIIITSVLLCTLWIVAPAGCEAANSSRSLLPARSGLESDNSQTVDAVSTATPGVAAAILADTHSGWKKADCFACHAVAHLGGFGVAECATCHGANGAPPRPDGHAVTACASCHVTAHPELAFTAPDDCTACHKFTSGTVCPATEDYDVVVIGAGGGGLSAAAVLAQAGMKVVVLEKHHKVGGYMTGFQRSGYSFDVSLHAMDGLSEPDGINVDIFKKLGIWDKVKRIKPEPMYRAAYPDFTIDIPSDPGQYRSLLKEQFPLEAAGIDRLFDEMYAIDRVTPALTRLLAGFDGEALLTVIKNPGAVARFFLYERLTLSRMLARFIHDQKLIAIWTSLSPFTGAEPDRLTALFFMVMWNSYHLHGFYYFEGGSQSVAEALADVVREHGGTIRLNTLATKIVIENGRAVAVRTDQGACYTGRYVVSNANAPDTILKLAGQEHFPKSYVRRLENMLVGLSVAVVYLGVNHDYRSYFNGTHEISRNESYDQHENFRYAAQGDSKKSGYSLCNYSVLDATAAPEGKNAITITTMLPYDLQNCWSWDKDHSSYAQFKNEVAMTYIQRAEELLPGLSQHIEVMEVGTPLTMKGYTLNPLGTLYGWDAIPNQSMQSRLPQQTPIHNLLLAGAWTFPGCGQSAVLVSGSLAADAILKKVQRQ